MLPLPKEKRAVQFYIRKLQPLANDNADGATQLATAVLRLWQAQSYPALVERRPRIRQKLLANSLVIEFAAWLSKLDILSGAFWLSSAYARWVGDDVRAERAMFFTPPQVSGRLIDNLIAHGASLTKHVWVDPASGGAAFLAPTAMRMAASLRKSGRTAGEILRHIAEHLVGNDIDACLAQMSKQFLRMVLCKEIIQAGFEPKFIVTTGNALTRLKHLEGSVDVVICNPPYRKMPAKEVANYRKDYHAVIAGQPNLYVLFFQLALDLLKPDGVAGLLTPTSYLSGQSFSGLRKHLRAFAEVAQLDIIGAFRAFVGVEQETAIAVFRRRPKKCLPIETRVFISVKDSGFTNVGVSRLPLSGDAWSVPRDCGDAAILKAINGSMFRLADYGYVARVGTIVWNRDKRKTYEELPKLKSGAVFPLVRSSDISQDGPFQLGRQRPTGGFGKYVDMRMKDHSSVVRRPCVALQRITSSDQPRRLVGAAVPAKLLREFGGVVGENHVVFLEQTGKGAQLTPTQLAKVLQSKTIDRLFRCISGAVNVSIFELDHLPLPNPIRLKKELSRSRSVDQAVKKAYPI